MNSINVIKDKQLKKNETITKYESLPSTNIDSIKNQSNKNLKLDVNNFKFKNLKYII